MTLKLPIIQQQWCLEAIDTQYKESLTRDRQKTKKSSSNSPYAVQQDLNASGSYSQPPAETSSDGKTPAPGNDGFRSLERKLERERDKRTRGETLASRLDSKGLTFRRLGLHIPLATSTHSSPHFLSPIRNTLPSPVLPEETGQSAAMEARRNGYRFASNAKSPGSGAARHHADLTAPAGGGGPYRTTSNRDALASMGSLTVAATPSSAALRGHSIGFGSRDAAGGTMRSPTQRGRTRGGTVMPLTVNDKMKNTRYPFLDPVPSASPSFQQRLSELAALEGDTIRYERTKRIKKRSKQENQ